MNNTSKKSLIIVLLLALIILRFIDLDSDPPSFYIGHGQAHLTDPYHLTHFAKNKILFDNWNPFEFHRWDIFKNSLVSAFSFLLFSLFGVSRITANLTAVLLNTGGLFLFLLGLRKHRGNTEIILTLLFLLLNSTLLFYGRLPFLENGLIFLAGLTFYIFIKFHDRIWGLILTGFLISIAALAGKLFGFILLGPAILTLIYLHRTKTIIPSLYIIGGVVIGAAAYLIILFGSDIPTLLNYYNEQTVGMYGTPPGFTSIANFFKMLLTFGGESGLYEYIPFFTLLSGISFLILILIVPYMPKPDIRYLPIVFITGWIISGILGLMPFQYRPLRYGLFLYLPLSAVCSYTIALTIEKKSRLSLHNRYISLTLIFFTLWYLLTQLRIHFSPFGDKFQSGVNNMFLTLIIALTLTGILFLLLGKKRIKIPRKTMLGVIGIICMAFIINQGLYINRGLFQSGHYLKRYNKELEQIIDSEAVITGPYGATLTADNSIKNIIYMFGLANIEKDLFEKYPISHIATDPSNWKPALSDFPFLKSAVRIVQMPIGGVAIDIFRVPEANTPLTDFEKGSVFLSGGRADSAYIYLKRFNDRLPGHYLGMTHLAYASLVNGRPDECLKIIDNLLLELPDDYVLHGFCKTIYLQLYNTTNDSKYVLLSQKHEALEKELKR